MALNAPVLWGKHFGSVRVVVWCYPGVCSHGGLLAPDGLLVVCWLVLGGDMRFMPEKMATTCVLPSFSGSLAVVVALWPWWHACGTVYHCLRLSAEACRRRCGGMKPGCKTQNCVERHAGAQSVTNRYVGTPVASRIPPASPHVVSQS